MIVGGGSGIGADAAKKMSELGYEVAILSSSGKGEALANELGGVGLLFCHRLRPCLNLLL